MTDGTTRLDIRAGFTTTPDGLGVSTTIDSPTQHTSNGTGPAYGPASARRYTNSSAAEEPSRVTWEIESQDGGVSLLTVVHDRLEGAPKTAAGVAGVGWMRVLSGLKTLLETGKPLAS